MLLRHSCHKKSISVVAGGCYHSATLTLSDDAHTEGGNIVSVAVLHVPFSPYPSSFAKNVQACVAMPNCFYGPCKRDAIPPIFRLELRRM